MSFGGFGWSSQWGMFRDRLAFLLGVSHDGRRDLYTQFGWPKLILAEQLVALYRRNAIAHRIIRCFPQDTWRDEPVIRDQAGDSAERSDKTYSPFVEACEAFFEKHRIIHRLERADRSASLGEFGVLLMGFQDGLPLTKPLTPGKAPLMYLQPYAQINVTIGAYNQDPADPRFGLPEVYLLKTGNPISGTNVSQKRQVTAHWTRVIHIAESLEEDDVFGTPRLMPVYNNLLDLEKVIGSSAETFWLNARPGLSLEADPDHSFTDEALADYKKQAEEYEHQLRRILALQGVKATSLSSSIADPSTNVESLLKVISGSTGIPERILVGSERGELGGDNDENNWSQRIDQRRNNFATPVILKPFITRLIDTGNLPKPEGHFSVEWPGDAQTPDKIATVGLKRTQALAAYVAAPGATMVVPFAEFRKELLGLPPQPPEDTSSSETDDQLQKAQGVHPDQIETKDAMQEKALKAPIPKPGQLGQPGDGKPGTSTPGFGGAFAPAGGQKKPATSGYPAPFKTNVDENDLTVDDLVFLLWVLANMHPEYADRIKTIVTDAIEPVNSSHANHNDSHDPTTGRFIEHSGAGAAIGLGAGALIGSALGGFGGEHLGIRYKLNPSKAHKVLGVLLPKTLFEKIYERLIVFGAAAAGGIYAGAHIPFPAVAGGGYLFAEWAARKLTSLKFTVPGFFTPSEKPYLASGAKMMTGVVDGVYNVANRFKYSSKYFGGGQLGRAVGAPVGMALGAVIGAVGVDKAVRAFERSAASKPKANFNPNHDPANGQFSFYESFGQGSEQAGEDRRTTERKIVDGLGNLAVSLVAGQVGATAASSLAGAAAQTTGAQIGRTIGGTTGAAIGALGSTLAGGPVGAALFGEWGGAAGYAVGATIGGAIGSLVGQAIPILAGSIVGGVAGDAAQAAALGVKPIHDVVYKAGDVVEHGIIEAEHKIKHRSRRKIHAMISDQLMSDLKQIMRAARSGDVKFVEKELTAFRDKYKDDKTTLATLRATMKAGNGE